MTFCTQRPVIYLNQIPTYLSLLHTVGTLYNFLVTVSVVQFYCTSDQAVGTREGGPRSKTQSRSGYLNIHIFHGISQTLQTCAG
jgi:hypothetical protein